MAATGPKFSDLLPRILSALVLLSIAALGLWFGGLVLAVLLSALGAIMLWEYFRLIVRLPRGVAMGYTITAALLLGLSLVLDHVVANPDVGQSGPVPPSWIAIAALVAAALAVVVAVRHSWLETFFGALIPIATFLFFYLHQNAPIAMWLVVATVIGTDVAGYFFGKLIGGPKFWPALSPNKTWAGIFAGWITAALIALIVGASTSADRLIVGVLFLILVAFAAQMADIAESALKRRAGVKDSSNLLPGHGGMLDRFDGMLGGFAVAGLAFVAVGYAMQP